MWKFLLALLVAYAGWRMWRGGPGYRPKRHVPVSDGHEAQARAVLGLGLTADRDAIRAAHRRLMADAHPDRGGSAERARELNAARDLLLSRNG